MRLGIDEAGRGPVIGPMIVAGVVVDKNEAKILKKYGVKDSKKLSRKEREELIDVIIKFSESFIVTKVWPNEIDANNLNYITYEKVIQIIEAMSVFKPKIITVDKVGKEEIVVEKIKQMGSIPNVVFKADENYIECSAASIVAKVFRDRIIDELKVTYGDFGSGYPSDPKTIEWIKKIYIEKKEPPNILRRSWKILQRIAPDFYIEKRLK
jgi:ribonuclease HII